MSTAKEGTSPYIKSRVDGHIFEITMDRPEAKNALTRGMYDALSSALAEATSSTEVRVVIIRGAHETFSAGNDLMDFMQNPPQGEDSPVFRFLKALVAFEKPLLAAVEGYAIGIGTTMLFHCDLVYAAKSARLQLPFVNLAVVPEAGSSLILPRMMGHQRAAELLFFGDKFGPEVGQKFGFINEVLPADELYERVWDRARVLAKKPPESLRLTKKLMKSQDLKKLHATIAKEGAIFVERLTSPELSEAISAFFEKREPQF